LPECAACAETLQSIKQTMALLDEWQAPEPSPYFDTRMQALLREERQKSAAHWYDFLRRPVVSLAAVLVMVIGIGIVVRPNSKEVPVAQNPPVAVGTAVGDLQTLDKNSELLSTYAALDDDDDDDTAVN
jgi:hypothetical protein